MSEAYYWLRINKISFRQTIKLKKERKETMGKISLHELVYNHADSVSESVMPVTYWLTLIVAVCEAPGKSTVPKAQFQSIRRLFHIFVDKS